MAACMDDIAESTEVISKLVIDDENLPEFDTHIVESEALDDLDQLFISDDELFVDLELPTSSVDKSSSRSMSTLTTTNELESVPNSKPLQCSKCQKEYKKRFFYDKHIEQCCGKSRRKLRPEKARKRPLPQESLGL